MISAASAGGCARLGTEEAGAVLVTTIGAEGTAPDAGAASATTVAGVSATTSGA